MRRAVILIATCLALAYSYWFVVGYAFGFAAAQPLPAWWWKPAHFHYYGLFYSQTLLLDTVVLVIVSLPFAYVVHRLFGRDGLLAAVAISLSLALTDAAGILDLQLVPFRLSAFLLVSALRSACVLPLLVLISTRASSNNRWGV